MCSAVPLRFVKSTRLLDQQFTRPENELAEGDKEVTENNASFVDKLK
jgi:hypothetical protein